MAWAIPGQDTSAQAGEMRSLLREGRDRLRFVVFDVEDGVQLGDLQKVMDLLGQVEQLEFAAAITDGGVSTDQLTDTGAVDVGDVAEVEQDLFGALAEQVTNQVAQDNAALAERDAAAQVYDGDAVHLAGIRFHGHL